MKRSFPFRNILRLRQQQLSQSELRLARLASERRRIQQSIEESQQTLRSIDQQLRSANIWGAHDWYVATSRSKQLSAHIDASHESLANIDQLWQDQRRNYLKRRSQLDSLERFRDSRQKQIDLLDRRSEQRAMDDRYLRTLQSDDLSRE